LSVITQNALLICGGLLLLALAADRLVVSAARLSRSWGMSPILVGALVIGMGTSAPELLASALASLAGHPDLAVGNAVGSNVANMTLVLGALAVVRPVPGDPRILRREGLLMLAAVALFYLALHDLEFNRIEGIALLVAVAPAGYLLVRWARADAKDAKQETEQRARTQPSGEGIRVWREALLGLVCLGATLFGADLLVRGGSQLAIELGMGEAFVGMTLIAVGTSLPELATAIASARRGHNELVVGNLVGSNLFNSLWVAGTAGAIAPGQIDAGFRFAGLAMVGTTVIAGLLTATDRKLVRWEGAVLLGLFAAFVWMGR
jgi:cation:H+ antiporter